MRRLVIFLATLLLLALVAVPGPKPQAYRTPSAASVIAPSPERFTEAVRYIRHVSRSKVRSIVLSPKHQKHKTKHVHVVSLRLPVGALRTYAYKVVGSTQYGCFDNVITAESHWNPQARNGKYYGLGQLTQYIPDPFQQIRAVDKYMTTRYGNPCAAWAFHLQNGWY